MISELNNLHREFFMDDKLSDVTPASRENTEAVRKLVEEKHIGEAVREAVAGGAVHFTPASHENTETVRKLVEEKHMGEAVREAVAGGAVHFTPASRENTEAVQQLTAAKYRKGQREL